MHAQNLVLNKRRHWKVVKKIDERFPQLNVISPSTFLPKAINAGDILALMIAPEHENSFWVFNLVTEEQAESLNALLTSIYEVSKK